MFTYTVLKHNFFLSYFYFLTLNLTNLFQFQVSQDQQNYLNFAKQQNRKRKKSDRKLPKTKLQKGLFI